MQSVNYNEISKIYDDVREGDLVLIRHLLQALPSRPDLRVLDIGCGTGNYSDLFQKLTQAEVYGIEPSEGMLAKARRKNDHVTFKIGQADNIPFDSDFFDFAYMTDVIHHVPDINAMFAEIWRVLKAGGVGCIVTQSHQQIEARPIAHYFPGTARVDKERYPDIDEIIQAASAQGFTQTKGEILSEESVELDHGYLELVRKKGYSMLHLISDEEYRAGLKALEQALAKGPVTVQPSGSTLVWFTKT
jgi:ubiquinone/menaquinone biosynthesis C-methylase UbiE